MSIEGRAKSVLEAGVGSLPDRARRGLDRGALWLHRVSSSAPRSAYVDGAAADGSGSVIAGTESPCAPVPDLETSQPPPLPEGADESELHNLFGTWSIEGEPPGHMDPYLADSFHRFLHTFGLAADLTGKCLELGSNPYFTTWLLQEHTELEVLYANYFDGDGEEVEQTLAWEDPGGTRHSRSMRSRQFNVEKEAFPYSDDSLDAVLFCEILEHLLEDPVAVLGEINRVLCNDGTLILTTPNVARLENRLRMIDGSNIYDPYSGFGPYGRHNREYTVGEVVGLLAFVGFEAEVVFTADGHPTDMTGDPHYPALVPMIAEDAGHLGGYIFVRARKVRPPRKGLPDFLFRSFPEGVVAPS